MHAGNLILRKANIKETRYKVEERSYCSKALIAKPGTSPYSNAYKNRTEDQRRDYLIT